MRKEFIEPINEETGFRNIKKIIEDHKLENGNNYEIWFHLDLDGLTSALSIKKYLDDYGLNLLDTHIIQYGGIEYCIKNKQPGSMAVLVDFSHSKPMFKIHTDHHSNQSGVEKGTSTYFKPTRSNTETLSGIVNNNDAFLSTDIELIQTVDSANFLAYNITPEDVHNSIFKFDKNLSGSRNRFLMGFVVNRLVLALKNKRISVTSLNGKNHHINKNLLECLVMDCTSSLYSIFNNIKHYIDMAVCLEYSRSTRSHQTPAKLATPEEIMSNLEKYINTRKEIVPSKTSMTSDNEKISYDSKYKIIKQYGIGYVIPTGSYDRYVVFKNFKDSEFVCTIFPMGLIQISCNPFVERRIKNIDLGELCKVVLSKYKSKFEVINISLSDIKKTSENEIEKSQKKYGAGYKAVGFRYEDLLAFYKKNVFTLKDKTDKKSIYHIDFDKSSNDASKIKKLMNIPYSDWTEENKSEMSWYKISFWNILQETSGGHKAISNLQSLNYLDTRRDLLKILFKTDKYTDVMNMLADDLITELRNEIDLNKSGKDIVYDTKGVSLNAVINNE